jgi:serine protease AprX
MRSIYICFLLALVSGLGYAQQPETLTSKYWVYFSDKGPDAAELLKNYQTVLPERLVASRLKRNMPVTIDDLPVSAIYKAQLQQVGFIVQSQSRWLNAVTVSATVSQLAALKASCSSITTIVPVRIMTAAYTDVSTIQQPAWSFKTTDTVDYGAAAKQAEILGIPFLHERGYTGAGITIAVLDAGFTNLSRCGVFDHSLQNGHLLGKNNTVNGSDTIERYSTHGTMVLSVITGYNPGVFMGTAYDADLLLAVAEPANAPYDESNWIDAAEWADQMGADIIQSSLGYYYDSTFGALAAGLEAYTYDKLDGHSTAITRAADKAGSKGIIVVNAAGNNGSIATNRKINAPCDGDSVLCVGAVDSVGMIWSSSSHGPTYDGRIKPDIAAMGSRVACVGDISCNVMRQNGTSLSAPAISGLAACLLQKHPHSSGWDVVQAIIKSGSRYLSPDTLYGHGVPNGRVADSLLSVWSGIIEVQTTNTLEVFPTPATGTLNITLPVNALEGNLQVSNLVGQQQNLHFSKNANKIQADIAALSPGIYLIQWQSADGSMFQNKFIKE